MKTVMSTVALVTAISMTPALAAANNYGTPNDPHERCKTDENKRQVLGGVAGAVIGGVVGSQLSGSGARTEGSAIGAVIGGLAGAGIADKTVDCDPIYSQEHSGTYQTGSSYGTTIAHPTHTTQYGSTTYSSSGQTGSQPYYADRITVSTHPVYSDPYYGAGALSQGRTYSAGTVSYPPSGNNTQYVSRTYQAAPVVRTQTAPTTTRYYTPGQPTTQRAVYTTPQQASYTRHQSYESTRAHRPRKRSHHHGRYSCDMGH